MLRLSHPITLCLRAHAYKGCPLLVAFCLRQRLLSASGKPPPSCLAFVSATPSVPSRLTRSPSSCAGPGASPGLGATPRAIEPPPSPSESRRVVAMLVGLRLDIVPLPRSISRANTLSCRRVVAHGCALWTPSRQPANRRPMLWAA
jgi:hypothetical protein